MQVVYRFRRRRVAQQASRGAPTLSLSKLESLFALPGVRAPCALKDTHIEAGMVHYAARRMQPNSTSVASMCRIVAYGSDWVKWLLPVIGQERFLKQVDFFDAMSMQFP